MSDVDLYSYPVLFIQALTATDVVLAQGATGVLIDAGGRLFLITNWHVVTGRHPQTKQLQAEVRPEKLRVHYRNRPEAWFGELLPNEVRDERLYDDQGNPRWVDWTPRGDTDPVDVVLLPTENVVDVYLALRWQYVMPFHLPVTTRLSIIGYPFGGKGYGSYPLWLSGTVASDSAGTYGKNSFFVDVRTRPGSSGSLVIHRSVGAVAHGPVVGINENVSIFCGIYSGRVDEQADIGIVWLPTVIERLLSLTVPRN